MVGQNAFAHEAGIHQDGMLKERTTYEIMNPEDVGLPQTELVLGKHSGRHALRQRVVELGYHLDEDQLQNVFDSFKALADRKKVIYDADIEALAEVADSQRPGPVDAGSVHLQRRLGDHPVGGRVSVAPRRHHRPRGGLGDGPIDAVFKAIEQITGIEVELRDYRVRSVTVGEDAQGEAHIEAEYNGRVVNGRAVSTDIIEASALAFLQVINRIALRKAQSRLHPQTEKEVAAGTA